MLSRVARGRIVQKFAQSVFAGTRYGVIQASRSVRIISVLPTTIVSIQTLPQMQRRFFSGTDTGNQSSLSQKLDRVSSFEKAVELIDVRLDELIES